MGHVCSSTVTNGQNLVVLSYEFQGQGYTGTPKMIPQTSNTFVLADGIPIMWQQSDAAILAHAATMTPTPQATTETKAKSPTASNSPTASTSTTNTPQPGLSPGAKIGLGVGIPVAVIALLAIGFLLWKRRQRRQPPALAVHKTVHDTDDKDTLVAHAPMYGAENDYQRGQPHYEMQADPAGSDNRHELSSLAHR
jgi:hypothetical protein